MSGRTWPTKRTRTRALYGTAIGLGVGVLLAWALVAETNRFLGFLPLQGWELALLDVRYRTFPETDRRTDDIVVVTIDESALKKGEDLYGAAWPWDRDVWGVIVDSLDRAGAQTIVLDVLFPDDRTRDASAFVDAQAGYNAQFVDPVKDHGQVVIGINKESVDPEGRTDEQVDAILQKIYAGGAAADLANRLCRTPTGGPVAAHPGDKPGLIYTVRPPWADLRAVAAGVGLTDRTLDIDQIERRVHLLSAVGDFTCPDLAAAAWGVSRAGTPPRLPEPIENGLAFGPHDIPVRADGSTLIRWRGAGRTVYPVVYAGDLLEAAYALEETLALEGSGTIETYGSFSTETLKGKIVLIGNTYAGRGAGDDIATPFGTQPGVYRHASVLDMLLTGDTLQRAPSWLGMVTCVLLPIFVALLMTTLFPTRRILTKIAGIGGALLLVLVYNGIALVLFRRGWVLDMSYTTWAMLSSGFWSLLYAFFFLDKDRREITDKFRQYTDAKIIDNLIDEYENGVDILEQNAGSRRKITLFFSDIAGFTGISERLTPEELVKLLNEYLGSMTSILKDRYDAVIDKYIGDAIMAFWGAPIPQADQAERAVLAALDNLTAMDELAVRVAARGLPPMSARIGLNTGFAVVGETGSDLKTNYTALGDTVNLAARLEGINKYYGTRILMGPQTMLESKHLVLSREVDLVAVKGKDIPVSMYEVMARYEDADDKMRELAERYTNIFELYKAGRFEDADPLLNQLLVDYPADGPSGVIRGRITTFLKEGTPKDWTGAWEMTTK